MAKNLLEAYKNKIAVADSYHAKLHDGERMDNSKKLMLARCLENTSKFLNEAFENTTGVMRSDIGDFKKFCLNLNTVVLPNLILSDLMITQAMASYNGSIVYLDYASGTNKGGVVKGDQFNGVFALGEMTEDRVNFTGQAVVETVTSFVSGTTKVAWTPVIPGTIDLLDAKGDSVVGAGTTVTVADDGTITVTGSALTGTVAKIKYAYNNEHIPANDLPTLSVQFRRIGLQAKTRRIAVFYSNLAAFQAKNDYGLDLAADLATQAVAELQYKYFVPRYSDIAA